MESTRFAEESHAIDELFREKPAEFNSDPSFGDDSSNNNTHDDQVSAELNSNDVALAPPDLSVEFVMEIDPTDVLIEPPVDRENAGVIDSSSLVASPIIANSSLATPTQSPMPDAILPH